MFKLICVTNRSLCEEDFLTRVKAVAAGGIDAIILREKDLSSSEYERLACEVIPVCNDAGVPCVLHSFPDAALHLNSDSIHLPLPILRAVPEEVRSGFRRLGTSCHSLADVREAEQLGCAYVTLGHIFLTDCKKGLPARGLGLLKDVCRSTSLPVYAIGGISPDNIAAVRQAGAAGACMMSSLMKCASCRDYIRETKVQAGG